MRFFYDVRPFMSREDVDSTEASVFEKYGHLRKDDPESQGIKRAAAGVS